MIRTCSRRGERAGFTMIELLVVIAIIAILVSLTTAAVMQVMKQIPITQTRSELSQFDGALQSFMTDYSLSTPPPSVLVLREDNMYATAAEIQTKNFLVKTFGRQIGQVDWNGNGVIDPGPFVLEGEQCLVFYLGGIQSTATGSPQCLGFSTNNNKPSFGSMAGETMGSRRGPYYPFKTANLMPGNSYDPALNSYFVYLDPYKAKARNMVYAYFSSNGIVNGYSTGDCLHSGAMNMQAMPYFEGTAANPSFTNKNGYQIISAGADGLFGNTFNGAIPWDSTTGAKVAGRDDQANFARGILAAGQ